MAEYRSRNSRNKLHPVRGVLIALGIIGTGVLAMLLGAWIAFEIGTRS